jgi:hypothetical protein
MADDEPAKRFILYELSVKLTNRRGAPRTTYREQISSHIVDKRAVALSAKEISDMARDRKSWSSHFAAPRQKKKCCGFGRGLWTEGWEQHVPNKNQKEEVWFWLSHFIAIKQIRRWVGKII